MHNIEPHYLWRNLYIAEEDPVSPFFGREYSEFEFTDQIYDHYIHPQWDNMGSGTLFVKIIFADYDEGVGIIELMGEWNDCLYNDIMTFKRNVIDEMLYHGINKFILIGENVLNFHASDDSYYEEWFDEVEDGWIVMLNFRPHVLEDMSRENIDQYLVTGGPFEDFPWATFRPSQLYQKVEQSVMRRLEAPLN